MKVFDLTCERGHRFEGWFASPEEFAEQGAADAIRCPLCDSARVRRAPSAPRLNLGSEAATTPTAAAAGLLQHLRRVVLATENVGDRFAVEARRIHYEETPSRAIRGTATDRERRELDDEGIETVSLPFVPGASETWQ